MCTAGMSASSSFTEQRSLGEGSDGGPSASALPSIDQRMGGTSASLQKSASAPRVGSASAVGDGLVSASSTPRLPLMPLSGDSLPQLAMARTKAKARRVMAFSAFDD